MSQIDHADMVRVLVKKGDAILSTLDPHKVNLWHAATGIAGEGTELLEGLLLDGADRENLIEESGDLYFYIEQMVQGTGIVIDWNAVNTYACSMDISPGSLAEYATRVAVYSGGILDTVKKLAIYNKELDTATLQLQLTSLVENLTALGLMHGFGRGDALSHNIAKLSKRYEGLRYTDEAAQKRADKV